MIFPCLNLILLIQKFFLKYLVYAKKHAIGSKGFKLLKTLRFILIKKIEFDFKLNFLYFFDTILFKDFNCLEC